MPKISPLPKGHNLLEYRIEGVLGQGGFGTTYLCLDTNLRKRWVIKEYTPHFLAERKNNGDLKAIGWSLRNKFADAKATFINESRKLAKFNHKNIVRAARYFEAHNTAYLVMDYEAGQSLRAKINTQSVSFSEAEIEGLIGPVAEGLAELHRVGLLHRDIKPDNIIVRPDGAPALIDFGAAVRFRGQSGPLDVVVTPAYSPPEQFDPTSSQGPATDIYALGAVMYELVCGAPPAPAFQRADGIKIKSAAEVGRGVYSDRILRLIDRCLCLEVSKRPQSIDEFFDLFGLAEDRLLVGIILDTAIKMITHFTNFATPNDGLLCEELIAFMILFPIIDLSWRIGKGTPDKATFVRLFDLMASKTVEICWATMADRGFTTKKRHLTLDIVRSRLDEYAATYLLDRQQPEWRYEMTRSQAGRNCLAISAAGDLIAFGELLHDVIDRARGRVKRGFEKAYRVI